MGLRNIIQSNIGKAFDGVLFDAVTNYTLYDTSDKHYNPVEGNLDSREVKAGGARGVFDRLNTLTIIDGVEKPTDVLVITLANEIPFTPKVEDSIVLPDGRCFKIINIEQDPAYSAYFMFCRAAS